MIKAAKSNYGLYAYLPSSMREIIKFTNLKKCNTNDVDLNGRLSCKNVLATPVEINDIFFFSPSGNYKIEMSSTYSKEDGSMFLVKANPNGLNYEDKGSAVVGCYSPTSGVSLVKEFSGYDKGEKDYITCGSQNNQGNGLGNGEGNGLNGLNGNGLNGLNGNGLNGLNGNGLNGLNGNGLNGLNGNGLNGLNGNGLNGLNGNGLNGNGEGINQSSTIQEQNPSAGNGKSQQKIIFNKTIEKNSSSNNFDNLDEINDNSSYKPAQNESLIPPWFR